jgi:hypothetical protein
MKPAYLGEALASATGQTRKDVCVVVADSGQWIGVQSQQGADMAALYAKWSRHPLVEWVTTGEPPDQRYRKCPVAWSTNEVIRAGLVRGRFMCTFYDDDLYEPRFFEIMGGCLEAHPEWGSVYCSQVRGSVGRDGIHRVGHTFPASRPIGSGEADNVIDGGQVMWRSEILDRIGDPWLPEEAEEVLCRHSDGIFLERLIKHGGALWPVMDILCENRKTPISTYAPSS